MTKQRLPFLDRLTVPVIAAPMLRVSGIELVSAACRAGVVGAFPTANCASLEEFDAWLRRLNAEAEAAGGNHAPYCPNLIMRRDPAKVRAEVDIIVRNSAEVVITSVGSPASVIPALHDGGCRGTHRLGQSVRLRMRGARAVRRADRAGRRPVGRRRAEGGHSARLRPRLHGHAPHRDA
jgi:NAD(P)H-dependent flavin oxidoreductase YrpB (nitropropane dioxygenase family)